MKNLFIFLNSSKFHLVQSASGLIEYDTREFRFLALERYTKNLQTVLDQNHNRLEENVVLTLCQQILHSLEYIHLKGYSHADIKGANLMLKNEKVYLIDFGLAQRFAREDVHITYKNIPNAKHNGTLE